MFERYRTGVHSWMDIYAYGVPLWQRSLVEHNQCTLSHVFSIIYIVYKRESERDGYRRPLYMTTTTHDGMCRPITFDKHSMALSRHAIWCLCWYALITCFDASEHITCVCDVRCRSVNYQRSINSSIVSTSNKNVDTYNMKRKRNAEFHELWGQGTA